LSPVSGVTAGKPSHAAFVMLPFLPVVELTVPSLTSFPSQ
jgi:hypothetical protein